MSIAQRVFPSAGAEPFSRNSRFCNTRPCSLPLSLELVHGPTSSSLHSPICLVDWTRRIRPCPWEICRKTASFSIDYYFLNRMTILKSWKHVEHRFHFATNSFPVHLFLLEFPFVELFLEIIPLSMVVNNFFFFHLGNFFSPLHRAVIKVSSIDLEFLEFVVATFFNLAPSSSAKFEQ